MVSLRELIVFCCSLLVFYIISEILLMSRFPVVEEPTRELPKLSNKLSFFLDPAYTWDYFKLVWEFFLRETTRLTVSLKIYRFLVVYFSEASSLIPSFFISSLAALSSVFSFYSFFSCLFIVFFSLFISFIAEIFYSFRTLLILLFLFV